jgi:ATP-dependent DNA helicase RecQ
MEKWFGYPAFRAEPADNAGIPLQEKITRAALAGQNTLGILPTGTGKSVCYQVPTLTKYDATGALTVVISPLQALMTVQMASLAAHGIISGTTIISGATLNGSLTMPHRSGVTDRTRHGETSLLMLSPEQLRNPSVQATLEHRQIAAWVLDEAHCLSKWRHDFHPDYRFIAKHHAGQEIPPVLCLTATAKPEVRDEITAYFQDTLNIPMYVMDGGAARPNLKFKVIPTTPVQKLPHLHQVLQSQLPPGSTGAAIVYCATRAGT